MKIKLRTRFMFRNPVARSLLVASGGSVMAVGFILLGGITRPFLGAVDYIRGNK